MANLQASTKLLRAIGPRLYPDASTGIIELVSNSYDADATSVRIEVHPTEICVADNGHGMSATMLDNFFTLGSSIKFPSQYGRQPIGQFGIGKFAILAMADKFQVYSSFDQGDGTFEYCRAEFDGAVIDDDTLLNTVEIPIQLISSTEWETQITASGALDIGEFPTGVVILLQDLRSTFSEDVLRAKVIERLSHTFKNEFSVFVNSELSEERYIPGTKYVVDLTTEYGPVTGEVVAAPDTVKLGDLIGVRVQVRGRTVKRELFGTDAYDFETSRQVSGYIDVEFLNDFITPDRTDFIQSPQVDALKTVMEPLVRSVIDAENENRTSDIAQQQSKMLNRAVRQVTTVLQQFPNLSFPEAALSDAIPVELAAQPNKSEMVANLEPENDMTANITAAPADIEKIIRAIQEAAERLRISDGEEVEDLDSYSDIVDAISKMLGDESAPLVEDINAILTGRILDQADVGAMQNLVTDKIVEAISKFVREEIERRLAEGLLGPDAEGLLAGGPILAGGPGLGNDLPGRSSSNRLRIRPPVVGNVVPIQRPLEAVPPLDSDTTLPTQIDPRREGNDENAAVADIQNYVAVTVEHLGPDESASVLMEGFGHNGTMIYVNADHHVYKEMEQVRIGFLSFYVASIIVDEVLGLQAVMTHREKINIKAELLKQMMLRDRKMLFRKN